MTMHGDYRAGLIGASSARFDGQVQTDRSPSRVIRWPAAFVVSGHRLRRSAGALHRPLMGWAPPARRLCTPQRRRLRTPYAPTTPTTQTPSFEVAVVARRRHRAPVGHRRTSARTRVLQGTTGSRRIADRDGLGVRIRPKGKVVCQLRLRYDGRQSHVNLGSARRQSLLHALPRGQVTHAEHKKRRHDCISSTSKSGNFASSRRFA